ncbi:MAG: ribonuclease HII [Dehalococcoidales bacterium]|nr:ribonuclease HII [Dehalococcoidales bacterium]
MKDKVTRPTFIEEKMQWQCGYRRVAGIDEAGRGPLAGPVVAAAVIMPPDFEADWKHLVNDSKQLSALTREKLFQCIKEVAVGVGVGLSDVETIDRKGIAKATRLAMKKAVDQLNPLPDSLLIDYLKVPEIRLPQKGITHGDCLCFSIACASIIAKVTRDRLMVELAQTYPEYGFAEHKGYGTKQHIDCLMRLGPSPLHRRSFQPVKGLLMLL